MSEFTVTDKFEVIRYAADGHVGEPGDGRCVGVFDTIDEARDCIRRLIGGDYGQWRADSDTDEPGYRSIECWHESTAEGCGGYEIRTTPGML
jgi:hypothetical protein